jgi:hypothetical protein
MRAFEYANFFTDETIIQISRPLVFLTRGHAKKIALTPICSFVSELKASRLLSSLLGLLWVLPFGIELIQPLPRLAEIA